MGVRGLRRIQARDKTGAEPVMGRGMCVDGARRTPTGLLSPKLP